MAACQEFSAKMARAHPWDLVQKYDEEFRRGAAGDKEKSWAEADSLLYISRIVPAVLEAGGKQGASDGEGRPKKRQQVGEGTVAGSSGYWSMLPVQSGWWLHVRGGVQV